MSPAIPVESSTSSAGLWTVGERRALTALLLASGGAVLGAWYLAAGRADLVDQLAFTALGVAGLVMALGAILSWMTRGRRRVGRRLHLLVGTAPPRATDAARAGELVAGGDRRWFHRQDCVLAVRRGWPQASRHDHERAGRQPCPACQP